MNGFARPLVLAALACAVAPASTAATLTVCPSSCVYSRIQDAIDAASPGDTVAVGRGTYVENLVVSKPLTLRSVHHGSHPVVVPALSSPNPCGGASLCGTESNLILVEADDVTIDGLTLDGDNPNLTSGVVAGGADLDARNGIITNHLLGRFNNLTLAHVTVRNVYLRGLYASSGGTFDFHDDVVRNVQADPASIAMFNFGGAGAMTDNVVVDAADAISSNHSRGVSFLRNVVERSASGVHTDNAGDGGGTADLIQWNHVSRCTPDGFGVWVFVPYISPVVKDNLVTGCAVGLAAFGQGSAVTTSFTDNVVSGQGAATSAPSTSLGVVVSTDILGFGSTDVSASFAGNIITKFSTGIYVEQQCELYGGFFPGDCATPGQATAQFRSNIVNGNAVGANGLPGTTVDAERNWWGCSQGPNHPGCDSALGTVDFTPWLTRPPR